MIFSVSYPKNVDKPLNNGERLCYIKCNFTL